MMRKPLLIGIVVFLALISVGSVLFGYKAWMRKANPLIDVPRAEFYKTINATTARVGDVVMVQLFIGWHGGIMPEYIRNIKIGDPFPEENFVLVSGNNIHESRGTGPGPGYSYLLKITGGEGAVIKLPEPMFYLDGVEIPLNGTSPSLIVQKP